MDAETFQKALTAAQEKFAGVDDLDATVLFDFDGEGGIFVGDGEVRAQQDGDEADCTIIASAETFRGLLDGDLNPTAAFMGGKMRVDGSMGVAMKLAQLLT